MNIRTANIKDAEEIAALEAVCFPCEEAASLQSIKDRLTFYPNHFWVMEDQHKIIAFVNGMVTEQEHLTDEMYEHASMHQEDGAWQMIFGVDTAPDYRRKGCAQTLLQYVIGQAKEQHRKGLVLTCKDKLVHYYTRFGFIDQGISESEHGGVIWHEMILKLHN